MDEKKLFRMICKLIVFTGAIILGVICRNEILDAAGAVVAMLSPFLIGAAIAFILNLPMGFIEKKLFKKWTNKKTTGLKRIVSILLSILFIVVVIAFVVMTVIPQLTKTLMELGPVVSRFFKDLVAKLEALVVEYPQLKDNLAAIESIKIDWNTIITNLTNFLKNSVSNIFASTVVIAGSLAGALFDGVISLVFAIYILSGKEKLGAQFKKLFKAYLPQRAFERTMKVLALCNNNFAKFISGQCLEAVILGTLFVIAMTIFRMPYAVLVGVLIAFTALIPIVGAFIGCIVGAFLILMVNPIQAVIFVVMFLVIQQLEGNLIYPRVVGNSVGLPAIWVLAAVSVGGSLFGVVGMLVFIPLMSTVYALLRENVNHRVAKKEPVTKVVKKDTAGQKEEKEKEKQE